ncbi:hypothetical protein EBT31_16595 [bacterium]|nr:hypothetical protein [bacterium]
MRYVTGIGFGVAALNGADTSFVCSNFRNTVQQGSVAVLPVIIEEPHVDAHLKCLCFFKQLLFYAHLDQSFNWSPVVSSDGTQAQPVLVGHNLIAKRSCTTDSPVDGVLDFFGHNAGVLRSCAGERTAHDGGKTLLLTDAGFARAEHLKRLLKRFVRQGLGLDAQHAKEPFIDTAQQTSGLIDLVAYLLV